jgi:Asp-tRNA(Asn)/Glu-tRNA(Gln) amidotransferase A subunit family amidase
MEPLALSLPALAECLRSGELPLHEYVAQLERRFAEREPQVLAFVAEDGRFERLHRQAKELMARFPYPATRPALFGVPVGVKDIYHVAGFATTGGSRLPVETLRGDEAASVTRLRDAGTLILGKTVTTEFAYFGPGPTRNPVSPQGATHTPGGSSSGSAAAVGARLAPLTVGTQTIGSIVRPASFCGVVGFKPTSERVSRAGVIPLSPSLDHIGPFATDVAGVQLAASVLIENWRAEIGGLRRPVLGIPEGPYLSHAEEAMLAHFRATCRKLADAGYSVKPVPAMPDFEAIRERHNLIVAAEAARVHMHWFAEYRSLYHPKTVELIERGLTITNEQLREALPGRESLRAELTALMDAHGIDLWLSPSAPGPAPSGLESTGNPVMNLPWTHAGLPALNLPNGTIGGLPAGLQLAGRWGADEELLQWASEIERMI